MGDRRASRVGQVTGRWARPICLVLTAVSGLLILGAVGLAVANSDVTVDAPVPDPASAFVAVQILGAIVWLGAALVLLQRPDLTWAPLAALAGLSHAVAAVAYGWAVMSTAGGADLAGTGVAVWLVSWVLPVEVAVSTWMGVTVPTGHLAPGRVGRAGAVAAGSVALGVVVGMVSRPDVAGTDFDLSPTSFDWLFPTGPLVPLLVVLGALAGFVVMIVRWRRSVGQDRVAMRLVVVIFTTGIFIGPLVLAGPPALGVGVAQVLGPLQTLALLAVVVRQRLLGIETVLDRSLRYVLLAGALAVLYVAMVAAAEAVFGESFGLVAAVTVALVALPLHDRLAKAVSRFVYGDRREPHVLINAIARQTQTAASPDELLVNTLTSLADGLLLRWASIAESGGTDPLVSVGDRGEEPTEADAISLVHRGVVIGSLEVGPHRAGDPIDEVDRKVLAELAPHLAMVVDSLRSAMALQRARDHLVQAREEERRRLRRDLHDGLGPVLTGAALSTDAASNSLDTDPQAAQVLLANVRQDLTGAIGEIRRIVENLRPPAIDELGLPGALAHYASRFPELTVTVDVPDSLRDLPAAVEVAAYRIASEAVTNAARHAQAHRVTVSARMNGQLEIEVTDDGHTTGPWRPGVGLESMRERTSELGGTLTLGPTPDGGRVLARLPVDRP